MYGPVAESGRVRCGPVWLIVRPSSCMLNDTSFSVIPYATFKVDFPQQPAEDTLSLCHFCARWMRRFAFSISV